MTALLEWCRQVICLLMNALELTCITEEVATWNNKADGTVLKNLMISLSFSKKKSKAKRSPVERVTNWSHCTGFLEITI
jgi:hypothetical protein